MASAFHLWTYNLDNKASSVRIGLGIGKVFQIGKSVSNPVVEPQCSTMRHGLGQMEWCVAGG